MSHFSNHLPWAAPSLAMVIVVAGTVAQNADHPAVTFAEVFGSGVTAQAAADNPGPREDRLTAVPSASADVMDGADQQVTRAASFDLLALSPPPAAQHQPQAVKGLPCVAALAAQAAQARVYFPMGGLHADPTGVSAARDLARQAADCPDIKIRVEGHAAASAHARVNQRLSEQRAQTVIAALEASGVDTTGFIAVGFGDTRPSAVTGPMGTSYYDRRVGFSVVAGDEVAVAPAPSTLLQESGSAALVAQADGIVTDGGAVAAGGVVPAPSFCNSTPDQGTAAAREGCSITDVPFLSIGVIGQAAASD